MDMERLLSDIKRHEGLRLALYRDTVGKLTIGYGRNIEDIGISHGEADMMLENDVSRAVSSARKEVPNFDELDDVRQEVLTNMIFNMGIYRFRQFVKMREAIEDGNFEKASEEMISSKWYKQVGGRARELVDRMRTGSAER